MNANLNVLAYCLALGWRFEFAGKPAQRVRGHGIADNDRCFHAAALLALEASIIETGGTPLQLRQQHAVLPAIRAAWSLDRGNMR